MASLHFGQTLQWKSKNNKPLKINWNYIVPVLSLRYETCTTLHCHHWRNNPLNACGASDKRRPLNNHTRDRKLYRLTRDRWSTHLQLSRCVLMMPIKGVYCLPVQSHRCSEWYSCRRATGLWFEATWSRRDCFIESAELHWLLIRHWSTKNCAW